jgi:NAD(P)-dependent dehydrogenase (short-subunit alcohol dehydrogenase family)
VSTRSAEQPRDCSLPSRRAVDARHFLARTHRWPATSASTWRVAACASRAPPRPNETPQLCALFDRFGEDEKARRLVHYPTRFGTPDEIVGTVAYVASDDAGFVAGAAIPLDGGITSALTVSS